MTALVPKDRSAVGKLRGYAEAALMVAASTLVGLAMASVWGGSAADLLYLPAVLAAAILAGFGPALFAALSSALTYNFFFTAPLHSFLIENPNDLVTVVVLFGTALVTSQLAASVRSQALASTADAARNAVIAGLARRLLSCTTEREITDVATRELGEVFGCNAVLIGAAPELHQLCIGPTPFQLAPSDLAIAATVLKSGERAGRGVDRALLTGWQFHPVKSGTAVIAIAGLARDDGRSPVDREDLTLLDSLLDQTALALERGRLEGEAREFTRTRERDRVRSILLSSLGQEVKPSLKSIASAVAGLRRSGTGDKALVSTVSSEATRIDRYISNLIDLGPEIDQRPLQIDHVTIDLLQRNVSRDGKEIHLTPKEFGLLAELAKHPGRVLTHAHLLRAVWGPAQEGQIDYLRVAIRALRQKLERSPSHPALIMNEPAVGYRLKAS